MKKPEPIELENNLGPDINGVVQRVPWIAYDKDEMDLYLAKKDEEFCELKENYRNLRRHLFKAGAEWAGKEKKHYTSTGMLKMAGAFGNMERMCLEMAENLRKEKTKCTT